MRANEPRSSSHVSPLGQSAGTVPARDPALANQQVQPMTCVREPCTAEDRPGGLISQLNI